MELSLLFNFDSSRRACHFSVFVCQLDEKWPSYDHAKQARQSGAGLFWAIRWYFGNNFWDTTFKLILPIIWINIDAQTELHPIEPFYAIKPPKIHKIANISVRDFAKMDFTFFPTPPAIFNIFS